ncbi:hypothetical protein L1887_04296 [Cichorium endivia]|nr:hypothetical protein L1887_04296 [Cichorium endivia]
MWKPNTPWNGISNSDSVGIQEPVTPYKYTIYNKLVDQVCYNFRIAAAAVAAEVLAKSTILKHKMVDQVILQIKREISIMKIVH